MSEYVLKTEHHTAGHASSAAPAVRTAASAYSTYATWNRHRKKDSLCPTVPEKNSCDSRMEAIRIPLCGVPSG